MVNAGPARQRAKARGRRARGLASGPAQGEGLAADFDRAEGREGSTHVGLRKQGGAGLVGASGPKSRKRKMIKDFLFLL
jgi:hypothetical protein